MVSAEIISDCISKTMEYGSAIAAIPCAEAMLVSENQDDSEQVYNREYLKRTQTPQGFRLGHLWDVHNRALKGGNHKFSRFMHTYDRVGRKSSFLYGV
jgi:2-C-methyl-D-erythritol 4-phosphate cytidylyltransferase